MAGTDPLNDYGIETEVVVETDDMFAEAPETKSELPPIADEGAARIKAEAEANASGKPVTFMYRVPRDGGGWDTPLGTALPTGKTWADFPEMAKARGIKIPGQGGGGNPNVAPNVIVTPGDSAPMMSQSVITAYHPDLLTTPNGFPVKVTLRSDGEPLDIDATRRFVSQIDALFVALEADGWTIPKAPEPLSAPQSVAPPGNGTSASQNVTPIAPPVQNGNGAMSELEKLRVTMVAEVRANGGNTESTEYFVVPFMDVEAWKTPQGSPSITLLDANGKPIVVKGKPTKFHSNIKSDYNADGTFPAKVAWKTPHYHFRNRELAMQFHNVTWQSGNSVKGWSGPGVAVLALTNGYLNVFDVALLSDPEDGGYTPATVTSAEPETKDPYAI